MYIYIYIYDKNHNNHNNHNDNDNYICIYIYIYVYIYIYIYTYIIYMTKINRAVHLSARTLPMVRAGRPRRIKLQLSTCRLSPVEAEPSGAERSGEESRAEPSGAERSGAERSGAESRAERSGAERSNLVYPQHIEYVILHYTTLQYYGTIHGTSTHTQRCTHSIHKIHTNRYIYVCISTTPT